MNATEPFPDHEAPRHGGNDGGIEDIIAGYLDRLNAGERLDPAQVLAEHPSLGPEILESLERFVDLEADPGEAPELGAFGDYTLRRALGRGGMGLVYEAWENSIGRAVALKVLPPGIAADSRASARFLREAQAAGRLCHPNVVSVYAMGVNRKTPYYAMELVDGETLAQVLERGRARGEAPPDLERCRELLRLFEGIAEGLEHAHQKGIIHRDIKPSNLILDRAGQLRILDFGLARLEGQESLTRSGDLIGTVAYMSPEQARRRQVAVDHRSDVYSLGATLYEMLTLEPPFRGRDHQETLSQIVERDPRPPRRLNPRVPADLETIVLKCLRKEPGDRYGTAEALAQDLERARRGDPVEARPEGAWERLRRRLRRQKLRLGVGAGFAVLIALAAILAYRGENAAREAALERYRPALLELAARLAAGEFSLAASATSRFQAMRVEEGPLAPFSRRELRRLFEKSALKSVRESAEELRRLTERLPGERDGHFHLARAYRLLGESVLAQEAARRALAIDPGFVPAAEFLQDIDGEKTVAAAPEPSAVAAGGPASGGADWGALWLKARRAIRQDYLWRASDRHAALEAFDALVRVARERGEPYAGLLLEAHLGRGVARLGLDDVDGAILDFAVARHRAPTSLEPVLLLAHAYRMQKKAALADSILEGLYQEMPPDRRDEAALWIALVLSSLGENLAARSWAGRLSSPEPRARLGALLALRLEDWDGAEAAARQAAALAPGDRSARLLLASALLERATHGRAALCEEWLELLVELKSLNESEPDDRHAAFLLRMALEAARPRLGLTSGSSDMGKTSDCFRTIAALALALGGTLAAAADEVILDDFIADPDFADGEPLTWESVDPCCMALVEGAPGEGLRLQDTGSTENAGVLMTSEVFSGDVTVRTKSSVGRSVDAFIHLNLFAATGYSAFVCARNCGGGRVQGWADSVGRLGRCPVSDRAGTCLRSQSGRRHHRAPLSGRLRGVSRLARNSGAPRGAVLSDTR
jgi:tetratricopeptide (TPR) repeat protein